MLNIIAAYNQDRVIGVNNTLPWYIPEDLKRFRKLTLNNTIIMGRRTFDSIGHPLSNRYNIVLTRNLEWCWSDVIQANSLTEAIAKAKLLSKEIFIIGGSEIFKEALPIVDKMYITLVNKEVKGDTFFPLFNERDYDRISIEKTDLYEFLEYRRKK